MYIKTLIKPAVLTALLLGNQASAGTATGLALPLAKGPFQNNGASPWYASVDVGTPGQPLKFSFDTGSNFVWVTSSLCGTAGCQHYGGGQFDWENFSSFSWIGDHPETTVDFGPWGKMQVEAGRDQFALDAQVAVNSDVYLAKSYSGQQFEELDWDGGIGMPSQMSVDVANGRDDLYRGMAAKDPQTSFHFFASLVEQGVVSADKPYLTFSTDPATATGQVAMGQLDPSYRNSREYLFLPWEAYSIPSVAYIWTTKLASFSVGDQTLATDYFFSLDSGSSQFKGDPTLMFETFLLTSFFAQDVTLKMGTTSSGETGTLVIPASIYNVKIEAGQYQGLTIPQFQPLKGLDKLALVGSVLMDYLYTVYQYKVEGTEISPVGMWIFNKPGGPRIIQNTQSQPATIFEAPPN
jgi:hypothetical protein